MKKVALILIIVLVSFSNSAFALPSQSPTQPINEVVLPEGMPEIISLLDTTPLYAEPDDKLEALASLSAQDVKVIRTQYGDNGYAKPYYYTWIQIHTTWLGDMWIKLDNPKIGVIRPLKADLSLATETLLYDSPYLEAANGVKLSPQTVHAKAEFVSTSGLYAIQIETSWLGDQWLIQPEVNNGVPETLSFPDAISPDYGELMKIMNIRVIQLGGRSFVQGQMVLQKEAWNIGRFNPRPGEFHVSGKLSFWNSSGDVIAQFPYDVYSNVGERTTASLLLPVQAELSSAIIATLQETIPIYISLPLPPLLNLTDSDGKIVLGILRHQVTGDYSVARAWISGKLPGSRDYKLTLTFYGNDNRILGLAHVHQRLNGPLTPDQVGTEGGGSPYLIDIVGTGNWTDYQRVNIHVDQVTDQ